MLLASESRTRRTMSRSMPTFSLLTASITIVRPESSAKRSWFLLSSVPRVCKIAGHKKRDALVDVGSADVSS